MTDSTFDAPDCKGKGCLATFRSAATAAVKAFDSKLVWCEHCKADGIEGRSMLSATAGDWRVMDCRGLSPADSGCCTHEGGRCSGRSGRQTPAKHALSG